MVDEPRLWPREQRIPNVVVGQPQDGHPEWWQALDEYRRSKDERIPPGFVPTAAAFNEAIDWWNRRAEQLNGSFEAMEAPQRASAEQAAAKARDYLAEDQDAASHAEHPGQWHATRHDILPLIQVNLVTGDPDGNIDEYVAWDVGRGDGVHIARHDPQRILAQCGALGDVLTDLERIAERSPDPDSRMWARGAIHTLARAWEPDDPQEVAGVPG